MITFMPIERDVLVQRLEELKLEVHVVETLHLTPREDLFEDYTETLRANIHLQTGAVQFIKDSLLE